jgi:hypothetical protein
MNQKKIIQPYMVLEIEDKIDTIDYFNYFLRNKKFIYLAIYETFNGFSLKTYSQTLRLTIKLVTIQPEPLIIHFDFTINDKYILNDKIRPYFIDESEFEICEKIKILDNKLNRIKNQQI